MILADVSIKRPVFATMMIFALVVLGLTSFLRLNIDLFPGQLILHEEVGGQLPAGKEK